MTLSLGSRCGGVFANGRTGGAGPLKVRRLVVAVLGWTDACANLGDGHRLVSLVRVFEQTVELPSTPGQEVVVRPGMEGRLVDLRFIAHEDPACGGFAQLESAVTL